MIVRRGPDLTRFDVQPYLDALRRYARVLARADQGADDLVPGALLRAYEHRASFSEGADLRVWLMTILHNHFIDQLRSRKTTMAREQAWAESNPGFALPDGEHVVRLDQLRRAFLALPPTNARRCI
jgi:RNA polymerase sigma-70 factor (ECF subfamily)